MTTTTSTPKATISIPPDLYNALRDNLAESVAAFDAGRLASAKAKLRAYAVAVKYMTTQNRWERKEASALNKLLQAEPFNMKPGTADRFCRLAKAAFRGVDIKDFNGKRVEIDPVITTKDMATVETIFEAFQKANIRSEAELGRHYAVKTEDPLVSAAKAHAGFMIGREVEVMDGKVKRKAFRPGIQGDATKLATFEAAYAAEVARLTPMLERWIAEAVAAEEDAADAGETGTKVTSDHGDGTAELPPAPAPEPVVGVPAGGLQAHARQGAKDSPKASGKSGASGNAKAA